MNLPHNLRELGEFPIAQVLLQLFLNILVLFYFLFCGPLLSVFWGFLGALLNLVFIKDLGSLVVEFLQQFSTNNNNNQAFSPQL